MNANGRCSELIDPENLVRLSSTRGRFCPILLSLRKSILHSLSTRYEPISAEHRRKVYNLRGKDSGSTFFGGAHEGKVVADDLAEFIVSRLPMRSVISMFQGI